jgi:hypothetical protein
VCVCVCVCVCTFVKVRELEYGWKGIRTQQMTSLNVCVVYERKKERKRDKEYIKMRDTLSVSEKEKMWNVLNREEVRNRKTEERER